QPPTEQQDRRAQEIDEVVAVGAGGGEDREGPRRREQEVADREADPRLPNERAGVQRGDRDDAQEHRILQRHQQEPERRAERVAGTRAAARHGAERREGPAVARPLDERERRRAERGTASDHGTSRARKHESSGRSNSTMDAIVRSSPATIGSTDRRIRVPCSTKKSGM